MTAEAPLLFAAAAAFAVISGVNDGGALLASGLQLRSLRPLVAIAMLAPLQS